MRYADAMCTCTEQHSPTHTYTFTGPCVVTGKPYSVTVPADGLFRYRQGAHVQDAFPGLSPAAREFLISGFSPEGWDATFNDGDDDGDDSEGQGNGDPVHEGDSAPT
jgi:hypothetical protein